MFRSPRMLIILSCVLALLVSSERLSSAQTIAPVTVTLEEKLGFDWSHEIISEPLTFMPGQLVGEAKAEVTGPKGEVLLSQVSDVERHADGSVAAMCVHFFADLPAGETRDYEISAGKAGRSAPGKGEESVGVKWGDGTPCHVTVISQSAGQPEMRVELLAGDGLSDSAYPAAFESNATALAPVRSIAAGGKVVATGELRAPFTAGHFEGKVTAAGPLFVEVEQSYELEQGHWQLRHRMVAGSPMMQVFETINTGHSRQPSKDADRFWSLVMSSKGGFKPEQFWYSGWAIKGTKDDLAHKLIPSSWNETGGLPRASWVASPVSGMTIPKTEEHLFSLTGWPAAQFYVGNLARVIDPGGLAVGMTSLRAMDWRNPMSIRVMSDKAGQLRFDFPIQMYDQAWSIDAFGAGSPNYTGITRYAPPHEARRSYGLSLTTAEDESVARLESLSSQTRKFAAAGLNEVRHMVLDWEDPLAGKVEAAEPTKQGLEALELIRSRVKLHHVAGNLSAYSQGNHQTFSKVVYAAVKPVVDDPAALPAEMRKELLRKLAFEAYRMNSLEQYPLGSGLHLNNPNMMIMAVESRAKAVALVPGHPMTQNWGSESVGMLRDFFARYSFPSGAPFENPHYVLGVTLSWAMEANKLLMELGVGDGLDSQRFRDIVRTSLNWLTPPDLRFNNHRVILPWGNSSYQSIPDDLATNLVTYLKDKDPQLAAEFQWSANQTLPEDKQIQIVDSKTPGLASRWIKDHGVVFRHGFGSENETLFYMLAGKTFGHYELETDHLAYTLYAKGHPIHLHFGNGYFPILNRPWMRNRVSFDMSIEAWERSSIGIADATLLNDVQYARAFREVEALWPIEKEVPTIKEGTLNKWDDETNNDWRSATGAPPQEIPLTVWQRQVAFVKDADNPEGPNYFVLRDTFEGSPTRPTHLSLWFLANEMTRDKDVFHFDGQVKVDMDVFMHTPSSPEVHTDSYWHRQQPYVRQTGFDPEYHPDGKRGETQQLLRVGQPAGDGYLVVLYPRLKGVDKPAKYERLGANAVRVTTPLSVDSVMLALAPDTIEAGGIKVKSRGCTIREFSDGRIILTNLEGAFEAAVGDKVFKGSGGVTAVLNGRTLMLLEKEDDASFGVK